MMQVNNLEQLLAWVKSSPCQFTVSSMSNECVHVKFNVPCDERVKSTDPDQVYTDDRGVRWRKEGREDRDELINRCYEDGFRDGRLDMYHEDHGEHKQHDEPEIVVPKSVEFKTCAELGDDDKYRKGYADGIAEVIGYVRSELDHFGG